VFFTLSRSTSRKADCKKLVKLSPDSNEHNFERASSGLTKAEHMMNGRHNSLPGQLAGIIVGVAGPVTEIIKTLKF
jgi:hypothetical protein